MVKFCRCIYILAFLSILFAVPYLTLAQEDEEYSDFEFRRLAQFPEYEQAALLGGEYFAEWETYTSDQIWNRDEILRMYVVMNMEILKRPVINEVVVQDELLLPYHEIGSAETDFGGKVELNRENLSSLKEEVDKYGGIFLYVGIPEQMSMLREYYPDYLASNRESYERAEEELTAILEEFDIDFLCMRELFMAEEDYRSCYSGVDHHYNLRGAYFTYRSIIGYLNESRETPLPVLREEDFTYREIPNTFLGSRSRKLYDMYDLGEKLHYYEEHDPLPFSKEEYGWPEEPKVFFLPEDDDVIVDYGVYMNGDVAETIMRTEREELPNVLLYGDSFTNPLETFLYHSFNESVYLDLRHYEERSLLEYVAEYQPDYVICLRDDTAYFDMKGNGIVK